MKSNKLAIKLLELARETIWNGDGERYTGSMYICRSICIAAEESGQSVFTKDTVTMLLSHVNREIDGYITVGSWLRCQGIYVPIKEEQNIRKDILTKMINHYKEQPCLSTKLSSLFSKLKGRLQSKRS